MKPKSIVTTLVVADLEKTLHFYRDGLGWETDDIDEKTLAFELPGLSLFFNETDQFVYYTKPGGVDKAHLPETSAEVVFSAAFEKKEQVDVLLQNAQNAGGTITEAKDIDGSYTGYFRDPDGHLWQLIWNENTARMR